MVGVLVAPTNPDRLALFDRSSSWVTGRCCPLAARGYSRDGKKGPAADRVRAADRPRRRPVAVRVLPGNTADPAAFNLIATDVREKFGLREMVMVGDRGMITSARIDQLRELGGLGWVTALRAPAITALAAGKIGIRIGKVIGKYRMAKHYRLDITDSTFSFARDQSGRR